MIVISQALVLSPAADEPLTNPVIGWHNLVTTATLTSDTEADGFPVTNLVNPATNLLWRGETESPAADEHLVVDVSGYTDPIDYLAVARHNFGSAGIIVSVEYLDTEESPPVWTELVEEQMLADDAPVIFRFTPQALESIRLRMQPGSEPPEAAVLYVGKLLVFEQGVQGDYTPLPFGRVTNIVSGVSEAGDFLGRITTGASSQSDARFANLTPAWIRARLDPFLEVSADIPFFFAWSPDAYPEEVGFAWLENNAQPAFNIDGYGSVDLNMTGVLA